MILGCHVSMKAPAYLEGSVKEALSYGATALMAYTGAPQNSRRTPMDRLKIPEARALLEENGIPLEHLVIHAPYIINLGNSVVPEKAEFAREFLADELKRVQEIGCRYLVLHPGAHMKAGEEAGIEWIVRGLNEVLDPDPGQVIVCLETMAGKGTEVGCSFEQLHQIIQGIHRQERIGVCLDTCHIHDAGYDVADVDGWIGEFDRIIGLQYLKVLHINDSKNVRGARKDRHENLGKGEIGFETLARIVHDSRFEKIPKILETPWVDDKPPYKEEIAALRAWKAE